MIIIVRVCALFFLVSSCQAHELRFSYITTITGGIRAIGARPLIDLALEEINSRDDILQNYILNYTIVRNSKCTRTGALDAFFEDFPYTATPESDDETAFLALLCCGCSPGTIPIAEISHYWNIPQIAFAAAANELTDRLRFKNFFRPLPSFEFIGESLAELVQVFNWRQMAIITQDETLFTGVNTVLEEIFKREQWTLDTSALVMTNETYFTPNGNFPFETAFSWTQNGDFRVIHINAYAEYAYMTLCKAFEKGFLPPKYIWITPMWYNRQWWKPISEKLGFVCTESELLQVLIGSIGVVPDGYFVTENDTAQVISGKSPKNFTQEYKRRLSLSQYEGLEELGIAGVAYDTVWSIALGLNESINRITNNNDSGCQNLTGDIVPLEMFNYTNQKMGCILKNSLSGIKFNGITGPVMFNSVGSRPDNLLLVQQYREIDANKNIERETVAHVFIGEEKNKFEYRDGESVETLWKTGLPYDGSAEEIIHKNSAILAGIYYAFAILGLILVLACLLFNIIFRNKKVVKLSSPNLNYLIIFGAGLLYVCVVLFVVPISTQQNTTILCNLRLWIFSLGYTLCFAVILSKTWRVYHIFNNPTAKKKSIKDWMLLLIIMTTVAIDVLILLIGTTIPNSRLQGTRKQDGEQFMHVTDSGENQELYVYICSTGDSVIWLGISFTYKGLLQLVAIFMAFHTRRVKIKALNDSKETAAIIYINSIVLVLMIVAVFVLEVYHNFFAALFGLALLVQATMFLGLLFIPKAYSLYKDPKGENVLSTTKATTNNIQKSDRDDAYSSNTLNMTSTGNNNYDPYETIRVLKERVKTLEARLELTTNNHQE